MSRRPNRDPLPLHKPEACSKYCNGLLLRVDATYFQMFARAPSTVLSWEWNEMVFDLRGHTYCCGSRGAQSSFQCTASVCTAYLGSTLP